MKLTYRGPHLSVEIAATGQVVGRGKSVEVADEALAHRLLDQSVWTTDSLEDLTREQLYERATERGIEGRSSMDKAQLIAALNQGDSHG